MMTLLVSSKRSLRLRPRRKVLVLQPSLQLLNLPRLMPSSSKLKLLVVILVVRAICKRLRLAENKDQLPEALVIARVAEAVVAEIEVEEVVTVEEEVVKEEEAPEVVEDQELPTKLTLKATKVSNTTRREKESLIKVK
jgi:hypothetical protein